MGIDDESSHPGLCSGVADGVACFVYEACAFSESRMREICLSCSMSGNRKQNQAKPDCGDAAKAPSNNHREDLQSLRLFSTLPQNSRPRLNE